MNVRLVLMLSLFGPLVAIATLLGVIHTGWESAVWAVIAVVCAGVLARQAPGKFFLHGFLTGFIAGAVAPLIQALFINQYLAHNPRYADTMKSMPGVSPAVLAVIAAPLWGAVLGVAIGFLTWVWAKFTRPKP